MNFMPHIRPRPYWQRGRIGKVFRFITGVFKPREIRLLQLLARRGPQWRFYVYLIFGWRSMFSWIFTPNYTKDLSALRKYDYDIRSIFWENAIKDLESSIEEPFFVTIITHDSPSNLPGPQVRDQRLGSPT